MTTGPQHWNALFVWKQWILLFIMFCSFFRRDWCAVDNEPIEKMHSFGKNTFFFHGVRGIAWIWMSWQNTKNSFKSIINCPFTQYSQPLKLWKVHFNFGRASNRICVLRVHVCIAFTFELRLFCYCARWVMAFQSNHSYADATSRAYHFNWSRVAVRPNAHLVHSHSHRGSVFGGPFAKALTSPVSVTDSHFAHNFH